MATARKPTLYIAGPMTGLPENNYPAFRQAERDLRAAGYRVHNPVRSDRRADSPRLNPKEWADWMRNGINQLIRCDGIALLPGYQDSKGAMVERNLAIELGLEPAHIDYWLLLAAVDSK